MHLNQSLSDDSSPDAIKASRGGVAYEHLGDPLWRTICNLLFLYNSAVQYGEQAGNLRMNRARYPELTRLTLTLATNDRLGQAARSGAPLVDALTPHAAELARIAALT